MHCTEYPKTFILIPICEVLYLIGPIRPIWVILVYLGIFVSLKKIDQSFVVVFLSQVV